MKRICLACSVAALIAACTAENPTSPTTTSTGENELNSMDVKCRAEVELGSSFDLTPVSKNGTTVLEGTLTDEDGVVTVYSCRPVLRTDDAGTSESIATCAPIDPNNPARWAVELIRDNDKRTVNARIDRTGLLPGESNAPTSLSCATLLISAIVPSYATVEPYIHRACGGCHGEQFDSLEKVRAQQSIMLGMISSGAMPRRDPIWRDKPEGKAVIAFLAKSHELDAKSEVHK